jgi:hypothetical protein
LLSITNRLNCSASKKKELIMIGFQKSNDQSHTFKMGQEKFGTRHQGSDSAAIWKLDAQTSKDTLGVERAV